VECIALNESTIREQMVATGESLFNRGLTAGSSGNLSVRLDDGWLITPTNVSLGQLDPARISRISRGGELLSGDPPSKESFLHLAMYEQRPQDNAIVHLHSTYSAAVSCMTGLPADNCLPPLTAYFVMKVNRLPLVPYYRPGDRELAAAVQALAATHHAILLANHGPIISGTSLEAAVYAVEELEETAKLFLLLKDKPTSPLTEEQIAALKSAFGLKF
jgi:ribulose-5-phosphate 4-epimerase/fuculose-1-phosphate aldolase